MYISEPRMSISLVVKVTYNNPQFRVFCRLEKFQTKAVRVNVKSQIATTELRFTKPAGDQWYTRSNVQRPRSDHHDAD